MRIRKKSINGKEYYYAQIDLRISGGKRKSYSVYLGNKRPGNMKKVEEKLYNKLFVLFFPNKKTIFLDKKTLVNVELTKRRFNAAFKKLPKQDQYEVNATEIVDFVYTTLRTEGVDVSRNDVETAFGLMTGKVKRILLDDRIKISARMIQGVKKISEKGKEININFIMELHGIVMQGFVDKTPGKLRDCPVVILKASPTKPFGEEIRYKPPAPLQIKGLLTEFFEWIKDNENRLTSMELAALIHLRLYKIHPFKDGNKRMCRLLFNKILLDNDYPVLNVSKDTEAYFGALINSVEMDKDRLFVKFVATSFLEQYGAHLGLTRKKK